MRIDDRNRIYHKAGGDHIDYEIANEAQDAGDSTITYYGYLAHGGAWVIQRETRDGTTASWAYAAGKTGYAANWTARESLSYISFSGIG